MERDYLELIKLTCISYPFPYTSHPSPLGTIRVLTNGIRAVDLEIIESVATHQAFIDFTFKGGDPFWRLLKLYEFFLLKTHHHISCFSWPLIKCKERRGNIFKMCKHQGYAQIFWISYALQDRF